MERVLQNNLKPATHFIEVYSDYNGRNSQTWYYSVSLLNLFLEKTIETNLKTIAIFKIRAK